MSTYILSDFNPYELPAIDEIAHQLVWLRSKEVVYSSEVEIWRLQDDHTVLDLPGFVWEYWEYQ